MYTYEKKEKEGVLKIKISKEVWENSVEEAYQKNKGKYNIQGFRKGKAPRKVIEQTYGDTVFFDDAFESVISEEYSKFLSENKDVQPAEMPHVEMNSFTLDKGIEATLTFALMPEVKLGKIEGLTAKKKAVKVEDKEIEAELESTRASHARYVEEDKVAENGDFATIDFSGSVDGVKFEGEQQKIIVLNLAHILLLKGLKTKLLA